MSESFYLDLLTNFSLLLECILHQYSIQWSIFRLSSPMLCFTVCYFILLFSITLGCSTAFATAVTTTIKEIIPADSQYSSYLILSESDGVVYEISESEDRLINTLNIATETHSPVELTVSQNTITSAKLLPKKNKNAFTHHASTSIDYAINTVTSTAPYAP